MPRSGTAFLAGLLASTGRVPLAREYFNPDVLPDDVDCSDFVARTVAETSLEGLFAAKFVANQLWDFLKILRDSAENDGLSDRALLERIFREPRLIWLQRQDLVAEAVSWWKAHQTKKWWQDVRLSPPDFSGAVFDFVEIDRCVREIVKGNETWEAWFAENQFEPCRVVYEDLDGNRARETRRVLDFLDVELGDGSAVEERSARQRDALNEEWIARYRSIASSRAPIGRL